MRGLDGNYMNAQADALARIQVAYLAEQNVQQLRAQAQAAESLRKLREEVLESQAGASSGALAGVVENQGERSRGRAGRGLKEGGKPSPLEKEPPAGGPDLSFHIDIKV